ncbi:MAG: hypothetical protein R2737_05945 [Candidatus Nanopelagicales bacterium]
MAAPARPADATLLVGPEPVLVDRALADLVAAVRRIEPTAEVRRLDASADDAAGALAEALGPTLFGDAAVVVVRGVEAADQATVDVLLRALSEPEPGTWVVVIHPGGAKGKKVLEAARATGAAEVACPEVRKGRDALDFLAKEVARHRRAATREALAALYDAVGHDVRLLSAAVDQLCVDVETDPIGVEEVARYFGGVAEVSGFQISDAVWERRPVDALRYLRWAAEAGDRGRIGPATVGAVASGLRGLVRYAGAPRGVPEATVAKEVGVPPWKLRVLRGQLQRWRPEQLARGVVRLAEADAAVKGGLREGENLDTAQKLLALERLVVEVAARPDDPE